jgi:hypothetical protein
MAKKTKEGIIKFLTQTEEGKYKVNTISGGLLNGTIQSFPQLFATLAKTNVQTLLGGSYYTSDEKILNPGKFTLDDIEFLADLLKVDFEVMLKFVRSEMNAKKRVIGKRKKK